MAQIISPLNVCNSSVTVTFIPIQTSGGFAPHSILMTKDGGFITTLFDVPYSSTPKNWLIKADSTGCFEVNCPVNNGLVELKKEVGELKVWPNPADDKISFKLKNEVAYNNLSFTLQNIFGEQVISFQAQHKSETQVMDISNLSKGIYFLRVESGNELLAVKKIIKN